MSPENLLVPTYIQMLTALSAWLGKAEQQMTEAEAAKLPAARLAPDMFPLATQIRFACVQAQEGMFRIRGEELPPSIEVLLEEGRSAGDHSGSIADAQTRIEETLELVRSLEDSPERANTPQAIAHRLPNGMIFDFTAEQYARDWAIPQFYFHLMTAYAILRAQGVDLGKADYVAHMFAYIRPGTMPK